MLGHFGRGGSTLIVMRMRTITMTIAITVMIVEKEREATRLGVGPRTRSEGCIGRISRGEKECAEVSRCE